MKAIITHKTDYFSAYYDLPLMDCQLIEEYSYTREWKFPVLQILWFDEDVTVEKIFSSKAALQAMLNSKLNIDQINRINSEYFYMLDHPEIEEKIIEI